MTDVPETADAARPEAGVPRRRGVGWSVTAVICAVAAVGALTVLRTLDSFLFLCLPLAFVGFVAGIVGAFREPRGRPAAITSLLASGPILAWWIYIYSLTISTFSH